MPRKEKKNLFLNSKLSDMQMCKNYRMPKSVIKNEKKKNVIASYLVKIIVREAIPSFYQH